MLMVYGSGYRYHRSPGDTLTIVPTEPRTRASSSCPLMPPSTQRQDQGGQNHPGSRRVLPNHACFLYRSALLRGLLMSVRHAVNKSAPLSNPQLTPGDQLRRGTVGTPRTIFTAAAEVPPSDAGNMCKQKTARRSHRRTVAKRRTLQHSPEGVPLFRCTMRPYTHNIPRDDAIVKREFCAGGICRKP